MTDCNGGMQQAIELHTWYVQHKEEQNIKAAGWLRSSDTFLKCHGRFKDSQRNQQLNSSCIRSQNILSSESNDFKKNKDRKENKRERKNLKRSKTDEKTEGVAALLHGIVHRLTKYKRTKAMLRKEMTSIDKLSPKREKYANDSLELCVDKTLKKFFVAWQIFMKVQRRNAKVFRALNERLIANRNGDVKDMRQSSKDKAKRLLNALVKCRQHFLSQYAWHHWKHIQQNEVMTKERHLSVRLLMRWLHTSIRRSLEAAFFTWKIKARIVNHQQQGIVKITRVLGTSIKRRRWTHWKVMVDMQKQLKLMKLINRMQRLCCVRKMHAWSRLQINRILVEHANFRHMIKASYQDDLLLYKNRLEISQQRLFQRMLHDRDQNVTRWGWRSWVIYLHEQKSMRLKLKKHDLRRYSSRRRLFHEWKSLVHPSKLLHHRRSNQSREIGGRWITLVQRPFHEETSATSPSHPRPPRVQSSTSLKSTFSMMMHFSDVLKVQRAFQTWRTRSHFVVYQVRCLQAHDSLRSQISHLEKILQAYHPSSHAIVSTRSAEPTVIHPTSVCTASKCLRRAWDVWKYHSFYPDVPGNKTHAVVAKAGEKAPQQQQQQKKQQQNGQLYCKTAASEKKPTVMLCTRLVNGSSTDEVDSPMLSSETNSEDSTSTCSTEEETMYANCMDSSISLAQTLAIPQQQRHE